MSKLNLITVTTFLMASLAMANLAKADAPTFNQLVQQNNTEIDERNQSQERIFQQRQLGASLQQQQQFQQQEALGLQQNNRMREIEMQRQQLPGGNN